MKDINGLEIEVGDEVRVPDPNDSDIHNHSFVGTVADIFTERKTILVEDGDSDFFELEPERLEKVIFNG